MNTEQIRIKLNKSDTKMPDYANGQIYRLVSNVDEKEYVGSTCSPLPKRFYSHKTAARRHLNQRVYAHFNTVGWENVQIILIENYPCDTKRELERRERRHIEERASALNKNIPTREAICEHNRARQMCRDCNGSGICEHNRQRLQCKECGGGAICEHNRKEQFCIDCGGAGICDHGRQRSQCKDCGGKYTRRVACDCGATTTRMGSYAHKKSKKHKFWQRINDFIYDI